MIYTTTPPQLYNINKILPTNCLSTKFGQDIGNAIYITSVMLHFSNPQYFCSKLRKLHPKLSYANSIKLRVHVFTWLGTPPV